MCSRGGSGHPISSRMARVLEATTLAEHRPVHASWGGGLVGVLADSQHLALTHVASTPDSNSQMASLPMRLTLAVRGWRIKHFCDIFN